MNDSCRVLSPNTLRQLTPIFKVVLQFSDCRIFSVERKLYGESGHAAWGRDGVYLHVGNHVAEFSGRFRGQAREILDRDMERRSQPLLQPHADPVLAPGLVTLAFDHLNMKSVGAFLPDTELLKTDRKSTRL